jgi:hypoxia up-regulated 1
MHSIIVLLLVISCLLPWIQAAAVIGIDFGSEWFKVALVKPGVPLDMVLNRESKRKTRSLATIHSEDQILFGTDSAAVSARFPTSTFDNLKSIIGKHYDSNEFKKYVAQYGHANSLDERRKTPIFTVKDSLNYSVEELVAMQLIHAREQAEIYAKTKIDHAVLTIPPYFTLHERRALINAAELAGLNVASLIHEETAGTIFIQNFYVFRFYSG